MALIKREAFRCDKCKHEWISDKFTHKNPPISCGKCKSAYWDTERKKK